MGSMVAQVKAMYCDVLGAFGSLSSSPNTKQPREVTWTIPIEGSVTLNVDGSAVTTSGLVGFGGLVRDHSGSFLHGFYGSVGVSDIMHA